MTDVAFGNRLREGWGRATGDLLALALIPLLAAMIRIDELLQVLAFDGIHVGVRFAFPAMIVDGWTFISTPTPDGVHVSPALYLFPLAVVVHGLLGAGYLGSIYEAISTEPGGGDDSVEFDFVENVVRYGGRLLTYAVLVYSLLLPFVYVTLVDPGTAVGLVLLGIPVGLLLWYLFFATPYLVVIADESLIGALGRSFDLATSGGAYVGYAVRYFGFVLVVSLFVTTIAVNLDVVGVVIALVGTAPLGLALNVATVDFLADLTNGDEPRPADPTNGDEPRFDRSGL